MPPIVLFAFAGEIVIALALIGASVLAARHRGTNHHWLMLPIFGVDLVVFKTIMYVRAFSGAFGSFPWTGTAIFPHMVLSWLWVIAGALAIGLAFRFRVVRSGRMFMPPKGRIHRVAGGTAITFWYISFIVGLLVFWQVYV